MSKVIDFKQLLPTPTVEYPYVQIDWIFNDKASTFQNKHTSKNYLDGCKLYKRFLRETDNYSNPKPNDKRFFIKKEWDKLALVKLKRWIDTTNLPQKDNYLTSHSMVTLYGAVRQTMLHAYENYHINEVVINAASAAPKRESNIRSAFSEEEVGAIFKYLLPEIQFSESLLKPYKKTNKGRDPRVKFSLRNNFRDGPNYNEGWRCPIPDADGTGHVLSDDNARWYFENVMNCVPLSSARENAKEHKAFFQAISVLFGGVYETYRRWGVTPFTGTRIIMPLVVKLISETGLNVESVFSLKRDCLKEAHPLNGLPYIEYEKVRSGGEKILPLTLLEQESANDEILALGQKQSVIVSNTITAILKLTEPLVEKVLDEDKNIFCFMK